LFRFCADKETSSDTDTDYDYDEMTVFRNDRKVEELYQFKEVLGSGRFGKVTLVVNKLNGDQFAAKQMACRRPSQRKEYEDEVSIMKELHHPKLLQCEDAFIEGRTATLILELVTGGELFDRISDENFELTEEMAGKYVSQILEGVNYMHSLNVLHLDLKPENILCLSKEKFDEIKIIDFGFARHWDPKRPLKVMFGTPEFVAPEVVNFDTLGKGTDVWSIGVIAYVMVSGLSPFMGDNEQETLSNVSLAEVDFDDDAFNDISSDATNFIESLLTRKERDRPSCEECSKHKWLAESLKKQEKENAENKRLTTARLNLRKFIARRRLQRSFNAVRAITRLSISLKKSLDRDDSSSSLCQSPATPDRIVEEDEKTAAAAE